MQKEDTFREVGFLSYKIQDISALQLLIAHTCAQTHSFTGLLYLSQLCDLVKV